MFALNFLEFVEKLFFKIILIFQAFLTICISVASQKQFLKFKFIKIFPIKYELRQLTNLVKMIIESNMQEVSNLTKSLTKFGRNVI